MPRLQCLFIVLKHNLDEIMERSPQNRCTQVRGTFRWAALDGIQAEYS
ncbi:hypothetical protein KSS87_008579, partial [Heliosperma pusillum]